MVSKITKEKKGFNERKTTVFKKAKQLSTLCDVDLLLIFLYGSNQPNVPQVWCSKPDCANDIIGKYYSEKKSCNKVVGNSKKQELKHIIDKKEFIKDLGIDDLTKLAGILEGKIESVNERLNFMKQSDVGSDYYCHGVVDSQLVTDDYFDGFDLGDVGYAPVDSRQAGVGSDCFHNQTLFFGGYEGKVEDMGERVNQIEGEVDLEELLMQFEVDDFGFDDFNAELLY